MSTLLPDHVRNTLARQAAVARAQRFELVPMYPEPSAMQLQALDAQIAVLEARNRELLTTLQQLTLKD